MFTLFHMGRYEDVIEWGRGLDGLIRVDSLMRLGRFTDAIEASREAEREPGVPGVAKLLFTIMRTLAEGDTASMTVADAQGRPTGELIRDPEFHFWWAGFIVRMGDFGRALSMLRRAVDGGFFCLPTLVRTPSLTHCGAKLSSSSSCDWLKSDTGRPWLRSRLPAGTEYSGHRGVPSGR